MHTTSSVTQSQVPYPWCAEEWLRLEGRCLSTGIQVMPHSGDLPPLPNTRPYPWWVGEATMLADGTEIYTDRRTNLERDLEPIDPPARDNTLIYDCGKGGLEILYSPMGWPSARKAWGYVTLSIVRPGHEVEPTQAERRKDPFAKSWWVPAERVGEITVRDYVYRRPTGTHPPAGSSPRYEANRRKNARQAKGRVRRLIRKYMGTVRMWTLTFARNVQDVAEADAAFRAAMRRLRRYFQAQGKVFRYVAVREFQRRGAIHYHVIVNQYIWKPKTYRGQALSLLARGLLAAQDPVARLLLAAAVWRAVEAVHKDRERHAGQISMNEAWPYGHNWVSVEKWWNRQGKERTRQTALDGRRKYDKLAGYLSKYIVKALDDPVANEKLKGRHLYLRSQGMFVTKEAIYTKLSVLHEWLRRHSRRIRQQYVYPVTISTKQGDVTINITRIDTT